MTDTEPTVAYRVDVETGVADIVLSRPEARNAQNRAMTYELDRAFHRAAHDPAVRVVILSGEGPHFSAGHDMRDESTMAEFEPVGGFGGFDRPGAEGLLALEEEIYLGMCRRWRAIAKPTIAQVHGKTIGGGLMLVWVCDLIVASDDATFSDPVVAFGMCGVEYFAHPWELGPRKAKELLMTGDPISADDARSLGMVNRVVPREDLRAATLELAQKIARQPTMAIKLIKKSVNQTVDVQGQAAAIDAAFGLHQLNHSHNQQLFGMPIDPSGIPGAVGADRARRDQGRSW